MLICDELGFDGRLPAAMRRNVIIEGVDLNELIGESFSSLPRELFRLERFTIEVSRCSTKKTSRLPRREKPLRTLV